jgi:hypothetical protein
MRGMSPLGGSINSRRVACVGMVALAGVWLGGASAATAGAVPCPNAEFRSGPSEQLPDCRAYEQVSPVEKGGSDALTLQPLQPYEPAQSSACEESEECTIAYMNVAGAFAGSPGNEFVNAYLGTRGAEGWETTALTPPTPQAPADSAPKVTYAFSDDLSQVVLRVPLQQLTANAPAGVYNLFLRSPSGAYSLITAATPAQAPEAGCGHCFESQDVPFFAGASADFSHVIFEANDSLVEGAPGAGVDNLYESIGEHVRLVGILPDGTIPPLGASAGGGIDVLHERTGELEHAISRDGSQVLFEAASDGGPEYTGGPEDPAQAGKTELYDRIDGSSTVEVSAPGPGAQPSSCETEEGNCEPEPAQLWDATPDGSVVYFTSGAALTRDSYVGAEGDDLYRYDVGTRTLSNPLADADPGAGSAGASVLGVVGASEDGSYVYFVAKGALAAGASRGKPNMYVWHETAEGTETVRFIATLRAPNDTEEEEPDEEENIEQEIAGALTPYRSDIADWTSRPVESQAYVTPDGAHLAFMSVEPLTGYENKDQVTGEPDHEVFEYSAETGRRVCASCDPSGAPPLGSAFIGAKLTERASSPFHQPRSLSDDGSRLFFASPDPLVPGLSGGSVKVFEYENGTAQLISGAEPGGTAVFLDASASGDDVFFATREQLAPSDHDELVDVYDARVDGGLPAPSAPEPCSGGACQEPFSALPSFPAPASASFSGPGDLAPSPPAKPTRKQLLERALSRCRKLTGRRRRAQCVALAKRRYAPEARRKRRGAVPTRRPARR